MFGISGSELLVIVAVALIVFGPGQLPEVARTIGRALRQILRMRDDIQRQFRDAIHELERQTEISERPKPAVKREERLPTEDRWPTEDSENPKQPETESRDHP